MVADKGSVVEMTLMLSEDKEGSERISPRTPCHPW